MNKITFTIKDGINISYDITDEIINKKTAFQHVQIVKTKAFGRMVFVDGYPQSSDLDESLFNEILAHASLGLNPNFKKVFIAGGGPGGCLREVLKYDNIEHVTLCDLDEEAVSIYKEYLPEWNATAYSDPRTKLLFTDARAHLENHSNLYDCIIIDVPDPLERGTTEKLFTQEFYQLCLNRLSPEGVILTQAGRSDFDNNDYFNVVCSTLKSVFPNSKTFSAFIPCYAETWGFCLGSQAEYKSNWKLASPTRYLNNDIISIYEHQSKLTLNNVNNSISKDSAPYTI